MPNGSGLLVGTFLDIFSFFGPCHELSNQLLQHWVFAGMLIQYISVWKWFVTTSNPNVQGRQAPPTTPTESIVNFLLLMFWILYNVLYESCLVWGVPPQAHRHRPSCLVRYVALGSGDHPPSVPPSLPPSPSPHGGIVNFSDIPLILVSGWLTLVGSR